ncbi:ATP-binding protein [Microlunatus speluncae]|uniref:ATP-binding protein n=1 Tax=Microlunatus speluncae TaxID=2594267 RepID=UPI00126627D3|nr:ATP-binding protein [Microlunatus speluncae]
MPKLWITMAGPAGIGKSTLADGITGDLWRQGSPVEAFGEEELFTRAEFAVVAEGFRTGHYAGASQFEDAYGAWLAKLPDEGVGVMDWSPAGMVGDLPWALADRPGYVSHLRTVAAMVRQRVIMFELKGPVGLAVERAAAERGEDWLVRYDKVARAAGHRQPERLARIGAWAERHGVATAGEIQAAREAGWSVHAIDATRSPAEVRAQAIGVIEAWSEDHQ